MQTSSENYENSVYNYSISANIHNEDKDQLTRDFLIDISECHDIVIIKKVFELIKKNSKNILEYIEKALLDEQALPVGIYVITSLQLVDEKANKFLDKHEYTKKFFWNCRTLLPINEKYTDGNVYADNELEKKIDYMTKNYSDILPYG